MAESFLANGENHFNVQWINVSIYILQKLQAFVYQKHDNENLYDTSQAKITSK